MGTYKCYENTKVYRGADMNNRYERKVICLKDYKSAKQIGELRKYPDVYEYCLIPNYEDKFSESHTESIQMGDCFANLIKSGDHYVLISIIFNEEWNVQEIGEWIENYEIIIHKPTSSLIEIQKISSIIEAKKFKNHPIVLCKRGTESISLDPGELDEVTAEYEKYNKITNTGLAKSVELVDDLLDKDDCLGREYPGVSDEEDEPLFERIMENIQYSEILRGLFIYCKSCSFESAIIHYRTFEVEESYCPYCGCKIDVNNCNWVNGPL